MTSLFRQRIRQAQADANLQAALDANAERRIRVRQEAFASLPDHAALRQRARAVRADVIDHLEDYLAQFTAQLQAHGVIVHLAADAAEATQIVLGLAQQHKARLIAKSKTMVSEEIELNHGLEAAGLRVVETDLGEYIVQLRGERPSHIITPAVHLRRADVGRLFHEKLGMPYTEDIPVMTNVARQVLREVFLTADIGISGVNFGVAESGTLCVLTNEGNGRMVTTVPRVHIALMGLERLVPTLDDLALMLALLPRSATGQKLTVYGSLLHSPRRSSDPDGPLERHLVLVDNGRRRLRASPLSEALYCLRCGACLNACPVFRELGGHAYVGVHGAGSAYPGPIGSVLSPAYFGAAEFGQLARASSLCGACREACPVDINLPKLLLRVRAGQVQSAGSQAPLAAPAALRAGLQLFTLAATHPRLFRLAQRLAGLGGQVLAGRRGWLRLPAFTGWGYSKDFPCPARKPFVEGVGRSGEGPTTSTEAKAPKQGGVKTLPPTAQPPAAASLAPKERFAQELQALNGTYTECQSAALAGKLLAWLRERGITTLLAWEAERLPAGLLAELQANGLQVESTPTDFAAAAGRIPRLGLTGALAAAAETGTLVLPGGPGQPLTASLVVEIHVAVLRAADIYPTLGQALNLPAVRQAPAAALVSGPSRTADIEMTLTLGVHGPTEVHVFCVTD